MWQLALALEFCKMLSISVQKTGCGLWIYHKYFLTLLLTSTVTAAVRNCAIFKNKLMGVMVYFKPIKINNNQYFESALDAGNNGTILDYMNLIIWQQLHIFYCTYLNRSFLEAPREYVLHGLVPDLNWAPFWLLLMSMHLVATPSLVSCCLLQQFKFHT